MIYLTCARAQIELHLRGYSSLIYIIRCNALFAHSVELLLDLIHVGVDGGNCHDVYDITNICTESMKWIGLFSPIWIGPMISASVPSICNIL